MHLEGFRPFRRTYDGNIKLLLTLDDWPGDIPLPNGVAIGGPGRGLYWPSCIYHVEPDKTIEDIWCWFTIPLSLADAGAWFEDALPANGWLLIDPEAMRSGELIHLPFRHQTGDDLRAHLNLRPTAFAGQTDALIGRAKVHPWPYPDDEVANEGESDPAANDPEQFDA